MIPTKTLRERMTEALYAKIRSDKLFPGDLGRQIAAELVQAAIDAIGDPVLIKTADSLEPIFPLRAQDKLAAGLLKRWIALAQSHDAPEEKLICAERQLDAFRAWPTRKWPD